MLQIQRMPWNSLHVLVFHLRQFQHCIFQQRTVAHPLPYHLLLALRAATTQYLTCKRSIKSRNYIGHLRTVRSSKTVFWVDLENKTEWTQQSSPLFSSVTDRNALIAPLLSSVQDQGRINLPHLCFCCPLYGIITEVFTHKTAISSPPRFVFLLLPFNSSLVRFCWQHLAVNRALCFLKSPRWK